MQDIILYSSFFFSETRVYIKKIPKFSKTLLFCKYEKLSSSYLVNVNVSLTKKAPKSKT